MTRPTTLRQTDNVKAMAVFCILPLLFVASPSASQELKTIWSAQPTTTILAEEKSFVSAGATLRGTLLRPAGITNTPLVVVFHGASSPLRDEALYDHLKKMLPPLGIAVFVFDRRGSGLSEGKTSGNGYEMLADDGIAAAQMLSTDPAINDKKIGFWGLSQGGWLSILAAARYEKAAFAISVSAPMVTPDVQMNFAVENILRIKGYSQADIDIAIAARRAVDDFERGKLDRKTAQARLNAAANKPWFKYIYMDKTFGDPDRSGWAKEIRHDPLTTVERVHVPTLILFGSTDPWIPAEISVNRLKPMMGRHPNWEMAVVDGADHAMMTTSSPAEQINPNSFAAQAPNSPEYFGRIAAWLHAHLNETSAQVP